MSNNVKYGISLAVTILVILMLGGINTCQHFDKKGLKTELNAAVSDRDEYQSYWEGAVQQVRACRSDCDFAKLQEDLDEVNGSDAVELYRNQVVEFERLNSFASFNAEGFPIIPTMSETVEGETYHGEVVRTAEGCSYKIHSEPLSYTFEIGPMDWGKLAAALVKETSFVLFNNLYEEGVVSLNASGQDELRRVLTEVAIDEDKLYRLSSFLETTLPEGYRAGVWSVHDVLGELWESSRTDFVELEARVTQYDAIGEGEDSISFYAYGGASIMDGRLLRRWMQIGRGQAGADLMVLYRYYVARAAARINHVEARYMAYYVRAKLPNTQTLKYRDYYYGEMNRIITELEAEAPAE